MALMATDDPTPTHPTDSDDALVARTSETALAPRNKGTGTAAKTTLEPPDSTALDPYDNIACTD
jgi:hypothetical protein